MGEEEDQTAKDAAASKEIVQSYVQSALYGISGERKLQIQEEV